ncbi:hypothetical protein BDA96_04G159500 [Sorghum bicolor]|nr:hypothetical protein BDA96_04G159500 [Sorghum bicolor]
MACHVWADGHGLAGAGRSRSQPAAGAGGSGYSGTKCRLLRHYASPAPAVCLAGWWCWVRSLLARSRTVLARGTSGARRNASPWHRQWILSFLASACLACLCCEDVRRCRWCGAAQTLVVCQVPRKYTHVSIGQLEDSRLCLGQQSLKNNAAVGIGLEQLMLQVAGTTLVVALHCIAELKGSTAFS